VTRDLFPAAPTPFHWSLLQQPSETALRRAWADLKVTLPDCCFWRREANGHIYLNADVMRQANRALHNAAWLVEPAEAPPSGLFARLQAQSIIRHAQAQIARSVAEAASLRARLTDWLARIWALRWTQADLLQVMEELAPQAQAALRLHFIVRAGLAAAQAHVTALLHAWWPDCPTAVTLGLYAGLASLPSAEAAHALAGLNTAADRKATQQAFLACYGHRGPGEAGPHALRWRDRPDRLRAYAALSPARDAAHARAIHDAAVRRLQDRLGSRWRQLEPTIAQARALCGAVDMTWDGFVCTMAAAQTWLRAVAGEALAAGLIADATEAAYLEFEELKQVATGEWHRGHSAAVRAEVARRQIALAAPAATAPAAPRPASPGQATGPLLRVTPTTDPARFARAVLVMDVADPGQAAGWLAAAGLLDAAGDPWSPGMIVARSLALPAVSGMPVAAWQADERQIVTVDADISHIALAPQVA